MAGKPFTLKSPDARVAARGLGNARRDFNTYADDALTEEARKTATVARANIGRAPGTWPKSQTEVSASGEGVALKAPWAAGAEYGGQTWVVFGHRVPQSTMKRRTLGAPRADANGYIVTAAIKTREKKSTEDVGEDVTKDIAKDLQGLPRGF